ncbi:hypothetical protein AMK59_5774 [Oryctes borbonicus]|uniref:Trafficking protein particle complex subunit 8 n=1 Tax=Oryctes borbonicus TaxID=1629725 RepID=A0A0T6B309_9SCAR|nr:hypothetical protein AMK59_5774 [Oryctes borbonicus]
MAQCKLTPQEFIKNSFTPQVAVICSPKAEETCRKNNLSFTELLQPFCKLGTEAHYKDLNGGAVSLRNFKISLQDINYRPPQPVLARKFLNASVNDISESRLHTVSIGDYTLQVPYSVPWFEAWRDTFLQVQFPSDHEFTKHFIACMLIVSTTDDNPVRMMVDLSQKVNDLQMSPKLPKWFSNNVMRYYIIIHETMDSNHVHAVECYDALKMSYGTHNCFLLKTNSRRANQSDDQLPDPWSQFISTKIQYSEDDTPEASPSTSSADLSLESTDGNTLTYHPLSPEGDKLLSNDEEEVDKIPNKTNYVLHGACLSMEDVEQLKLLIHEFCIRALLPFVERQVSILNEYVANKKGVSRSLFSATKRWFTPHKPGSSGATNAPIYYLDAPELQVRRLGDLYFMFGNYSAAFQAYHTAKRDFNADQAWLHYAGALEMAALSAFMANETSRKTLDYMEESITTYLNTCKMAQFATRATLFSFECLKGRSLYGDAAHQLIRMTSEESDLRSALLLEQAAYCFLHSTKPTMVRKYAFHMVLAGHRFSKAAQRKHSLRCYKQAYQVYQNKGWNLALDHIYCTIGKQANNLDLLQESIESYAKLLSEDSRQSPQQQALFLKEYLTIHNILNKKQIGGTSNQIIYPLPLPLLVAEHTKVLVAPTLPLRIPGKVPAMGVTLLTKDDPATSQRWQKLEEMVVQEVQGSLPMIFKPMVTLFTQENCNMNPTAILGEPIQVLVQLRNPLQILLLLKDIYLLWQYSDDTNKFVTNEIIGTTSDQYVKTHYIKSVVLQANSAEDVILTLTPLAIGQVVLVGTCYSLVCSNNTEEQIEVKGKQVFKMNERKKKKENQEQKPDKRLHINVVPPAACLQVSFCEINPELLRNELQQISVELRNVGSVPLHKVYMATSTPHLLSSCDFSTNSRTFDDDVDLESHVAKESEARRNHITSVPLVNNQLDPGQCKNINIWIKAPDIIGPAYIDLLIYYENVDAVNSPKYRLVRHVWNLSIQESIKVNVTTQQSSNSKTSEQLTLSVTATNMNKMHHVIGTEISVLNSALLSEDWTLLNEMVAPECIKLHSQESVHIVLKAQRRSSKNSSYSVVSFVPHKQSLQYSNSAYLDFAKRNDQNRINVFDTSNDIENLSKNKKVDATLILRWQAHVIDSKSIRRTVYGQNQVPVYIIQEDEEEEEDDYLGPIVFFDNRQDEDSFTPNKKKDDDLSMLQRQISYNLIHPVKISHDFTLKKLCIIRIKMLLHSIAETSLEVIVKTLEISR